MKKKILELFCGTKSISKEFIKEDFEVLTLDFDNQFNPDICENILDIPIEFFDDYKFDYVWASPPCNAFSVAVIGKNWNYDNTPKNDVARTGLRILEKTLEIINRINPKIFFIENPRGKMRKMFCMQNLHRHTVTYCQYGDFRQKPTDIFSNIQLDFLKSTCKRGSNCHVSSPRGSYTGTQGIKGSVNKAIIPEILCRDIAKFCKNYE